MVLYGLTSTYFEAHRCPLAHYDYSRAKRRSNPQIVFGILSSADGGLVQSFQDCLKDLATIAKNCIQLCMSSLQDFTMTTPGSSQRHAPQLLRVRL